VLVPTKLLTAKLHSLYVRELETKFGKSRSWCRTFFRVCDTANNRLQIMSFLPFSKMVSAIYHPSMKYQYCIYRVVKQSRQNTLNFAKCNPNKIFFLSEILQKRKPRVFYFQDGRHLKLFHKTCSSSGVRLIFHTSITIFMSMKQFVRTRVGLFIVYLCPGLAKLAYCISMGA